MTAVPFIILYVMCYAGCVIALKPSDPIEGATALLASLFWPFLAVGWLVSRPFSR